MTGDYMEKTTILSNVLPKDKLLITPAEAAVLCSVSYKQIDDWTKNSDFPVFKVGERGGKKLIPVEKLKEWVSKRASLRWGM